MKRGRPRGPDIEKIKKLLFVLKQTDIIWVSQLARIARMKESTARYYINNYLYPFIEEIKPFDRDIRKFIKLRLIRLKKRDITVDDIIKFHKIKAITE